MQQNSHREDREHQFDFWSRNPCGAEGTLRRKIEQRYRMEPWIPREIERFPSRNARILEVGCGQGVDAFAICARLDPSCEYIAIDYSAESIGRCQAAIEEAKGLFPLPVVPGFRTGDALALPFGNGEFDFVYSLGAIHHTPDPAKAIREIHRVLKPGGRCVVYLYRYGSLKVGVAKLLRACQWALDKIAGKERTIYRWLLGRNLFRDSLGTMLLECFGVPWMYWYTRGELEKMFAGFAKIKIEPYGFNLHLRRRATDGRNPFGYFFKIEAVK